MTDYKITKSTDRKVTKSNHLVQCKSTFSALEHRIILLALSQIHISDTKLKLYRINIKDVVGNKDASRYKDVRKAVDDLHQSTIKIEEGKKWRSYSFIIKAQGEYGKNYIEIQFHEDIQEFLLGLKSQYTTYTLRNVIKFRKNYSLRIYELCKQYQKIGFREMTIDYLKTLFSLERMYSGISTFKKRVLSSAIEEINKYSDLYIDIDFILNGRKIEKVKFYISKNKQIKDDTEIKTLAEVDIEKKRVQRLLSVGLSNYEIQFILMDYKVIHIDKVLDSCESEIQSVDTPKIFVKKLIEESSKELDEPSLLPWSYQPKIEKLIESENLLVSNNAVLDIKKLSEQINLDKKMIETYNQQVKRKNIDLLSYDKKNSLDELLNLQCRVIDNEALLKKFELRLIASDTSILNSDQKLKPYKNKNIKP